MIELPPTFAVQCVDGQRWLVVAPDHHSLAAGRTFERRELRAVDVTLVPPRRAKIETGNGDGAKV